MKGLVLSLFIACSITVAHPLMAQNNVEKQLGTTAAVIDPAQHVRDLGRLARTNDLIGLLRATVPTDAYQHMLQAYELHRLEPTSEHERSEFAEGLAKLSAPNAVEQLMSEIEPKLVEARPKAPAAMMMGLGALQLAVLSKDSELTADQRAALQQALPGLQRWLNSTDFLSSLSMRQALTLLSDAVRGTGVRSLDELKAMSFEQALTKAETVLAAGKQVLLIYGLNIDSIIDSLQVEVIAIDGSTARVRTTVTVFDAPISSEHDLVLKDGRWYGKKAFVYWTGQTKRLSQR